MGHVVGRAAPEGRGDRVRHHRRRGRQRVDVDRRAGVRGAAAARERRRYAHGHRVVVAGGLRPGSRRRRSRTAAGTASRYSNEQWIALDFGVSAEYGGLIVDWDAEDYATAFDLDASIDGTQWTTVHSTERGNGGRDYLYLPDSESRFLRLRLHRSQPRAGVRHPRARACSRSRSRPRRTASSSTSRARSGAGSFRSTSPASRRTGRSSASRATTRKRS